MAEPFDLALEEARLRATRERDTTWMRAHFASDFTFVHSSGRLDSAESYLELLDAGRLDYLRVETGDLELRYNSTQLAQVLYRLSFDASFDGAPISVTSLAMTTWALVGGSWKIVSITSTKI